LSLTNKQAFETAAKIITNKTLIKLTCVVVLIFLDIWLLSTAIAYIIYHIQSLGNNDIVNNASWYLHYPFQTIIIWAKHCLFHSKLINPMVFNIWVYTNIAIAVTTILLYLYFKVNPSMLNIRPNELKFNDDPSKGTAKWATPATTEIFNYKWTPGILFGQTKNTFKKPLILPSGTIHNRNVAVYGASGSMKSRAYVRNNILQAVMSGESVIVTDPKGELTQDFYLWIKQKDYQVKIFNLVSMINSDRWNPLSDIKDDIDAQIFSSIVIENTLAPSQKKSDPFWTAGEQNLLKALSLYVVNEMPEEQRNIGTLYSLLTNPKSLDTLFSLLDRDHPAKAPYGIFTETSGVVRSGIILGLGARLQVFQNKLVQEITSNSDIDLELPGKEKCAYFCIISDTETTFSFLASLFFNFLFMRIMRMADRQGHPCRVHPHFILDEFCNISAIPDFTKKISTMRSRGLSCTVIFQNIAQLKERYPYDAWQEIIGNCDFRLFLGANDPLTAKYVSENLGEGTIYTRSRTRDAGPEGVFDWGKVRVAPEKRSLMTVDEVLRMNRNNAVLMINGRNPLLINKMDYTKHPYAKELTPGNITDYWPEWSVKYKNGHAGDVDDGGVKAPNETKIDEAETDTFWSEVSENKTEDTLNNKEIEKTDSPKKNERLFWE